MIIGQHGTPQSPHYYLEIDSDERYSARLRKMFRHTYLRLRHSMDGPTETGGLIVTQAMRRRPERIGKQLSWVRFAYIGRHLKRFQDRVIAEMLPPTTDGQGNIFWDHSEGASRDCRFARPTGSRATTRSSSPRCFPTRRSILS